MTSNTTVPAIPAAAAAASAATSAAASAAAKAAAALALVETELKGKAPVLLLVVICVWVLPWWLMNSRCCCRCFKRWVSRHLQMYFCLGLCINSVLLFLFVKLTPGLKVNTVFFAMVEVAAHLSDGLHEVLQQSAIIVGIVMLLGFRKKLLQLLGIEFQLFNVSLSDCLTCFTMSRLRPIEVSIWKIDGLLSGFYSRTLYLRVLLGFNEAQHTRPHEGVSSAVILKERLQLNYDPEDETQTLTIVVKEQEVLGAAVSRLAPATGAILGGAAGLMSPLGPAVGAGLGVITGVGAANSVGVEIARLDLSSAMINRWRAVAQAGQGGLSTGPGFTWSEQSFVKVDLVPQGHCYLRIGDVLEP